jgi:beta-glucanase (GH16 family)
MAGVHTYTIEWTKELITFAIDGDIVRTATLGEANGGRVWPQTPAQVRLGTWAGGSASSPAGTAEWAGGRVDWGQAPFKAMYKSVKVTDYCGGHNGASEYVWGDRSGEWGSIQVKGGTKKDRMRRAVEF